MVHLSCHGTKFSFLLVSTADSVPMGLVLPRNVGHCAKMSGRCRRGRGFWSDIAAPRARRLVSTLGSLTRTPEFVTGYVIGVTHISTWCG